jgi:hypothetical protein
MYGRVQRKIPVHDITTWWYICYLQYVWLCSIQWIYIIYNILSNTGIRCLGGKRLTTMSFLWKLLFFENDTGSCSRRSADEGVPIRSQWQGGKCKYRKECYKKSEKVMKKKNTSTRRQWMQLTITSKKGKHRKGLVLDEISKENVIKY